MAVLAARRVVMTRRRCPTRRAPARRMTKSATARNLRDTLLLTHLTQWRGLGRLRLPRISLFPCDEGYASVAREKQESWRAASPPNHPPRCRLRKVSY